MCKIGGAMKRTRGTIIICMTISFIMLCGCAKNNNSDNKAGVTVKPTSSPTETIAPTKALVKNMEAEEKKVKAQQAKAQKAEAIQVLKDYFIAVKEHDKKDPFKYLTRRLKHGDFSNVKDAELVSISNKDGREMSYSYKIGTGADTSPYKVISFEVTYKILYKDDKKGSEPGGKVTKWFTLVKEKETSTWLIAAVGY